MSDHVDEAGTVSAFERHAQTFIGAVITALVMWVGYTLHTQTVMIAEMGVEIRELQLRIEELRSDSAGQYTTHQAAADHARLERSIAELDARVRVLEERERD